MQPYIRAENLLLWHITLNRRPIAIQLLADPALRRRGGSMTLRACRLERSRHTQRDAESLETHSVHHPYGQRRAFTGALLSRHRRPRSSNQSFRIHRGLGDALIEKRGEASQLLIGWIEVEDGQILSVMAHPP
jgi:hypothetical protein